MKRLMLSIITLLATAAAAVAQGDITFEALAPRMVAAGEVFRVEFTIKAESPEFIPPAIDGLEILAGPTESHTRNTFVANGEVSREVVTSFIYVLRTSDLGIVTVPEAKALVRGKTYTSKPVSIEVVAADAIGPGSSQGAGTGRRGGGEAVINAEDVLITATVNRNNVYKGEAVLLTLKLYSRINIAGFEDHKFPSFNGFWQQDITSEDAAPQRETYKNRVYETGVLKEYLLYPQQSGTLSIEPFEVTVAALFQSQTTPRDIFEELMGGGMDIQTVRRKLSTSPIKIEVMEWPAGAPAGFNGAVGEFSMEATPPSASIGANTSGTYTIRLSGTGNFPLIRAPKIELPASFEEYTVKSSESYRHSRAGTAGYRQFEYPFIPRMEGGYTIPEFQFSYFDPKQARYMTLSTRALQLEVAADSTSMAAGGASLVSGLSREELKILGRDIRFIKLKSPNLKPKGRVFMWSPLYLSLMALTVILFFVGLVILRKYVKNMQNDRFVRGKRANKVALKRFRSAEASMKQGDKHGFYDEMLKALWGYMSDKLDIPMADLTKDRIREELFVRSVPEIQANEYTRIISECEEAQYSPTSSARMNDLYKDGVNLVSELESAIKR